MVNPGAFQGLRREFLWGQKPVYAEAVVTDMAGDCIVEIQRKFFKRFPLDLEESVEPSEDALAAVDDDAADPEPPEPDEDVLSPEEYLEAMEKFGGRTDLLIYRRSVSFPRCATNNVKLTHVHGTANQALDCIPARQGPSIY